MIRRSHHQLILGGDLDLCGENIAADGTVFELEAEGDDASWGNPQPIVTAIEDLLAARIDGWENAEGFVRVRILGDDVALAAGERELFRRCNRRTTLEWRGPGEFAEPVVFELHFAVLDALFDDMDELRRTPAYGLRITRRPFAKLKRSVSVEIPPPPTAPVVTTVDSCDSVTGWTSSLPFTQGVTSKTVEPTTAPPGGVRVVAQKKTTAAGRDLSLSKFLSTTWNPSMYLRVSASTSGNYLAVSSAGRTLRLAAASGMTRWYECPSSGPTSIGRLELKTFWQREADRGRISVYDVSLTDSLYVDSSGRSSTRAVEVQGSAPAEASLTLAGSSGLGTALVFTHPQLGDYTPDMSQHPVSGGSLVADASAVSGGWRSMGSGVTYTVPSSAWPRTGVFHLLARVKAGTAGRKALSWTVTVGGRSTGWTAHEQVPLSPTVVSLGTVETPALIQAGADVDVTVTLTGADCQLDVAWLFHDKGSLTWALPGTADNLTVTSPTTDDPEPAVYADGVHVTSYCAQQHLWEPGVVLTYVCCTGVANVTGRLEYTPAVISRGFLPWGTS